MTFKNRWITALETTDHPQGKQLLYHNGAYCCLGIAAETMGELHINGRGYVIDHVSGGRNDTSYVGPNGELEQTAPKPITGTYMKIRDICIDLNDIHEWSFLQIAEWLRTVDF